jgi:hypothetical protein
MKSFITTLAIAAVSATSDSAQCAKMPNEKQTWEVSGTAMPAVSSVNGNWVLYGVPTGNGDEVTAAAPKSCSHDADGEALEFGIEVDMSCCMNGSASTTNLNTRVNPSNEDSEGFCSALPTTGDKGIGELTKGPTDNEEENKAILNSLRGLAMCTSKTTAVYGEFCAYPDPDDSGALIGDCNKCGKTVQKDLSSPKCFKASDAPAEWNDARQWFVMLKGCGCDYNSASAMIMGAAAALTLVALF